MLSRRNVLALCAALAALFLAPAAALAQSAGNQQYVDPLANQSQTTTTSKPTTPAPSTAPASSSAPSSSAAPAPVASSQATTTTTSGQTAVAPVASQQSSGTSTQASGRTLPFTGLDLVPAIAIGFGLVGAGIALRRATRRA